MICDCCKIDRLIKDFINKSDICYKCIYQKKLEKSMEKRTLKVIRCRTCGQEVKHIENLKKRQRTVFCSYECAEKGHREMMSNHWTRKVRSGRVA